MPNLFQYQVKAEPVSTSGESITPDKWIGSADVPRSSWARKTAIAAVVLAANTAFAFTPTPVVNPDQWLPRLETPRWDIKREQFKYPNLFYADTPRAENVTVDRWHPDIEKPRWDRKRQQYTYPSSFLGDIPRAESVTVDRWHPSIEQPRITRPSRIYESGPNNPYPIPNVVATPFDWYAPQSEPIQKRATRIQDSGGTNPYPIPSVTLDWQIRNAEPFRKKLAAIQTDQAFVYPVTAQAPFDWLAQHPEPFRAKPRLLLSAVGVVQVPQQNVTMDMWNPAQVYLRARPVPLYWLSYGEMDTVVTGVHLPCILQTDAVLIQPIGQDATLVQPVNYNAEEIACG